MGLILLYAVKANGFVATLVENHALRLLNAVHAQDTVVESHQADFMDQDVSVNHGTAVKRTTMAATAATAMVRNAPGPVRKVTLCSKLIFLTLR